MDKNQVRDSDWNKDLWDKFCDYNRMVGDPTAAAILASVVIMRQEIKDVLGDLELTKLLKDLGD